MNHLLHTLVLVSTCTVSVAQSKPAQNAKRAGQQEFSVYSTNKSRGLFVACDRNRDDRITYREALQAIVEINRQRFRKFDTNNDGRIQAPEFDRRFKQLTGFGGKLTLTKSAVQRLPATTADVSITLVRFFTNLDQNRDDRLSDAEWKPVEETLVALQRLQFTRLDLNMSGDLTLSELAVLDDLIKALHKGSAKKPSGKQRRPLPEELRAADLDADSLLSERELARALVRIHLTLARLAKQIIQRADTDGDQHLNAVEVQAARITRPARKPRSRQQRR